MGIRERIRDQAIIPQTACALTPDDPLLVMLLLDQSDSMTRPFGGVDLNKHEVVADVANDYLETLIRLCARPGAQVRPNYKIGVIGYSGTADAPIVRYELGAPYRCVSELDALATFEDRDTDDGQRQYSVWIKPATFTQTPTANALSHVHDLFAEWVNAHPTAHPPLLFHITDGIYTDQDPRPVAQAIQALSGGPVVFNCHISERRAKEVILPADRSAIAALGEEAEVLWDSSSTLPPRMLRNVVQRTGEVFADGARAYMFNVTNPQWIRHLLKGSTPRPKA